MKRDEQFLQLLENSYKVVQKYVDDPIDSKRYTHMMDSVSNMKEGIVKGTLVTNFITLPVMDMLDRNDPEDMFESLMAVWLFYRDHYQDVEW